MFIDCLCKSSANTQRNDSSSDGYRCLTVDNARNVIEERSIRSSIFFLRFTENWSKQFVQFVWKQISAVTAILMTSLRFKWRCTICYFRRLLRIRFSLRAVKTMGAWCEAHFLTFRNGIFVLSPDFSLSPHRQHRVQSGTQQMANKWGNSSGSMSLTKLCSWGCRID